MSTVYRTEVFVLGTGTGLAVHVKRLKVLYIPITKTVQKMGFSVMMEVLMLIIDWSVSPSQHWYQFDPFTLSLQQSKSHSMTRCASTHLILHVELFSRLITTDVQLFWNMKLGRNELETKQYMKFHELYFSAVSCWIRQGEAWGNKN